MYSYKMPANFLCCHHRSLLEQNSHRAKHFWVETVLSARIKISSRDWGDALTLYGNAMEAADILLSIDTDRKRREVRYSRTATELAYTIRVSSHRQYCDALVNRVDSRLNSIHLIRDKSELLLPVIEATQATDDQVQLWLSTRVALHKRQSNVIH